MTLCKATDFVAIAARALERMAFVIADPCPQLPADALARADRHAEVRIDGDGAATRLCLAADDGFLREVAAGMLGLDADEVDAAAPGEATLAELANILAGELVMAMGGAERPFRLGLPQATAPDAVGAALAAAAGGRGFAAVLQSDAGCLLLAAADG